MSILLRGKKSLSQLARAILTRPGVVANVWVAGIGNVSGLASRNFSDTGKTTAAVLDGVVATVGAAIGTIDVVQATVANKPFLRRGAFNLLTQSETLSDWAFFGAATMGSGEVDPLGGTTAFSINMPGASTGIHTTNMILNVGSVQSGSVWMRADAPGAIRMLDSNGNGFDVNQSVTTTWTRFPASLLKTVNDSQFAIYRNDLGQLSKVYMWHPQLVIGPDYGDYSPTTTAQASNATAGAYWLDFQDGSDVMSATFPAGYESATVIKAQRSGQTTLTAQNIVGTYNITADTSAHIIVKISSSISAGDLDVLQRFANQLA